MGTLALSQTLPPPGQFVPTAMPKRQDALIQPSNALPTGATALSPTSTPQSTVTVKVKGFAFKGNDSISNEQLQVLVFPYVGKQLDFPMLEQLADVVTKYYRSKGFPIARAYIPSQQIGNGLINIAIVEGRFGAIEIKNDSPVSDERIRQTIAQNFCPGVNCIGKVIKDDSFERGLLLLRDYPGLAVKTYQKPGQISGYSNLFIEASETKAQVYGLSVDNYGIPATGTSRLNFSADLNGFYTDGDQLSMSLATTTTTATRTGGISYNVPWGYKGLRVGGAFARNQYRLGGAYTPLQSYGISGALSTYALYPLVRTLNRSLFIRGSFEMSSYTNTVGASNSIAKGNANAIRIGFNGDSVDSWGGGGYTAYGFVISQGYVSGVSSNDPSAGRYGKFTYSLARQQALKGPMTLYGSLSGQVGNKNLPGSEQTGIGGPSSVRGYSGEAGGSTGASASIELRYTQPLEIGANITYGAFLDRGWVRYYEQPTNLSQANSRALSSYGLSLTIQSQPAIPTPASINYFARMIVGWHPMGAADISVVDPTSRSKFWIQGGMSF